MAHVLSACLAMTIAGCGTSAESDSESVPTRNIWAGIELESRGNGNTRVKVELNDGGQNGPNVRLTQNERLDVDAGGLIVTLREDEDFGDIDYEGTVPTDAGGTLFRILFFRADGTINGGSVVSIASPFDIASPVAGMSFPLGSRIPITWTPGTNSIELEVFTRCPLVAGGPLASTQWFPINDSGTRSFDTSNLQIAGRNDLAPGGVCDLDIALRRERRGSLDPAFRGGGYMRAIQVRRVESMSLTLP